MKKAPSDGVYEIGGGRFKIKAGSPLPAGAEFKAANEPAGNPKNAESATIAAGEAAKENQPDETTEGVGPSETVEAQPADVEQPAKPGRPRQQG